MKGLLYKEWQLGKKQILCFLALAMLFSLLGFLVFLSMICGNLQSWKNEPQTVKVYAQVFFYTPYLLLLFAVTASIRSICRDYDTDWMKFSYTLPLKTTTAVGVKYLMSGLLLAGTFLYGFVNCAMISAISNETFSIEVVKNMALILVGAIALTGLFLPIAMKVKKSRTVSAIAGLLLAALYLAYGILFMYYTTTYGEAILKTIPDTYREVRDCLLLASPVLVLCFGGFSFLASIKIYQRRAK